MKIDDIVKVLEPFNETCTGTYQITEVVVNEDNTTAYILGELGGFDSSYLELCDGN